MRICLLYFSGTGLTSELARIVGNEFETAGHQVERIRFKTGLHSPSLENFDLIGIGAPAYSYNAPRIFLRFLKNLHGLRGQKYFLFLTSHSAPGITALKMDAICRKKDWQRICRPIEGKGVNNIRAWRPKTNKKKPVDVFTVQDNVRNWVETALKAAAQQPSPDSSSALTLPLRPGLTVFTWFFSWRWQMAVVEGIRKRIDRNRCTRCGLCWEKICPSGAMRKGKDGFPSISHRKCVGCSGCVNLCPSLAVYTGLNKDRWAYDSTKRHILSGH